MITDIFFISTLTFFSIITGESLSHVKNKKFWGNKRKIRTWLFRDEDWISTVITEFYSKYLWWLSHFIYICEFAKSPQITDYLALKSNMNQS